MARTRRQAVARGGAEVRLGLRCVERAPGDPGGGEARRVAEAGRRRTSVQTALAGVASDYVIPTTNRASNFQADSPPRRNSRCLKPGSSANRGSSRCWRPDSSAWPGGTRSPVVGVCVGVEAVSGACQSGGVSTIFATYIDAWCSCVRMDLARTEALPRVQGGSDTEESDSEQPLTEAEQIVSILNTRASRPPPLPVEPKYAFSTSSAVLEPSSARHSQTQRTVAYDLALNTPIHATRGVEAWIEQQLDYRRAERTIRLRLLLCAQPGPLKRLGRQEVAPESPIGGRCQGHGAPLALPPVHAFRRAARVRGAEGLLRPARDAQPARA